MAVKTSTGISKIDFCQQNFIIFQVAYAPICKLNAKNIIPVVSRKENEYNHVMENTKKNKITHFLLDTVKGVTLGISVAIPGLSAGTIAVSERCYDTIVDSAAGFRKSPKKNFMILLPFLLGLLFGALAAFVGIQKGYKAAPFTLTGLFAGLVLGSFPVAASELKKGENAKSKAVHIAAFLFCLFIAAGLGIITALTDFQLKEPLNNRVWWMYLFIVLAGIIAAFACVIPGISGSMSMMVIGMYYPVLDSYIGKDAIWHSEDKTFIITGIVLGVLLAIGILIGLVLSSKIMKKLLSSYRVSTFYGILGLIIGSVISMFVNSTIYPLYPTIQTWDYITGSVLGVVAFGITFFLTLPKKVQEIKE